MAREAKHYARRVRSAMTQNRAGPTKKWTALL